MSSKDDDTEYITIPRKRPYKNVFQFKITLLYTEPPIWRRIIVPESYTFYDFHVAIQDAMGWWDYHLHDFRIEDETEERGFLRIECPWMEPEPGDEDRLITTEVPLKTFLMEIGDIVRYHYDYGDGWQLDVLLEDILPKEKDRKYPICVDGDLSGPPEDCGGVHGYHRCIDALADMDDSEGLLTWLGDWRPDDFDPGRVKFESPRKRFNRATED
ncbi:plasmid pRiA4b ORF-3 family protein [Acidobacteriota bacterium]